MVALGVLGGTVALAQPIVDLLLGPSYERSATVLPILMLAFVFISMGYLSGYLTTIVGKQWRLAAIAAGGVVANVALNFALIPPFGAVGAAWATVVTELAVNGLALWTVFRVLEFRPSFNRAIRTLFAAGIMTAAVAAAAQIDLIAGLLVVGPVYLGALLGLKAITKAELRDLIGRERRLLEPSQSPTEVRMRILVVSSHFPPVVKGGYDANARRSSTTCAATIRSRSSPRVALAARWSRYPM